MLDLELVSVRSAPGIVVKQPVPYRPNSVSIEVLEPEDPPLPRLALPPPPCENTYHIPRLPAAAPIKKKVHRLSAKKAAVLADKQAKLERKQNRKVCPRNKRFCKTCGISCNSAKTFYDHVHSRAHRIRVESRKSTPRCIPCDRVFESHGHLERHQNGAAHLKVVCRLQE